MNTIDARGLECPKPVLLAKQAVESGETELSVIVDNDAAVGNVTRFLEGAGLSVTKHDEDGAHRLEARKIGSGTASSVETAHGDSYAFLITSDKIGDESDGLGELLMKSWLGTIKQRSPLPRAIALMNSGVKLALAGPAADTLKEMSDAGVKILVCGTCAKHFGIEGSIAVGVISNMFEITETIYSSSKPITVR